ncbi:hypothetical protein [Pseudonocardia adelaidensis]|uniref:AbiV family abortive infection protein n=1 Tax=Pseudonocardia adelaidensis TaxID=648754 RepID=A0ABP9NME1_9PSEU
MSGSEATEEIRDEIRKALLEVELSTSRIEYASEILSVISNIEDWVAIDSWLGGGRVEDPKNREGFGSSFAEFRAVSILVSMSAELAEAAVSMARSKRYYAVGAIVRQLIECEYLLTWFGSDLDNARKWFESSPDEVRLSFSPKKMRKLTGFSNEEYWDHCSTGGHPAPSGARLLEKMDPRRRQWPYSAAEMLIDLGLHLRRIWRAVDTLLARHHARYARVRADQREKAENAWARWHEKDPLVAIFANQ